MSRGFHLTEKNAPRSCGDCGEPATAYIHETGFYCGDCHPGAPDSRAAAGDGRSFE